MNWKRGLGRIYIVLWALFALAGAFFPITSTMDAVQKRQAVQGFLREHLELAPEDLIGASLDSLVKITRFKGGPRSLTDGDLGYGVKLVYPESYPDLGDVEIGRRLRERYRASFVNETLSARFDPDRVLKIKDAIWQAANAKSDAELGTEWAMWAGICLAVPGVLLVTLAWIVSGFSRSND